MPCGLMGCQAARFSPEPRSSPSWYADHRPSLVVQAMQIWCQLLSFRLRGSWATWTEDANPGERPKAGEVSWLCSQPHSFARGTEPKA